MGMGTIGIPWDSHGIPMGMRVTMTILWGLEWKWEWKYGNGNRAMRMGLGINSHCSFSQYHMSNCSVIRKLTKHSHFKVKSLPLTIGV